MGDYMRRLGRVSQGGDAARNNIAGVNINQGNSLANMANTYGTNAANLNTQLAGDRASIYGNTAAGNANIQSGLGQAGANAAYGKGNALAASAIGVSNAITGGVKNAIGAYQFDQFMNAEQPRNTGQPLNAMTSFAPVPPGGYSNAYYASGRHGWPI